MSDEIQFPRGTEIVKGLSMTQQSMKDAADINNITARFYRTGQLSSGFETPRQAIFGDFTSVDFLEMRNHVADVEQKFAGFPARIRERFRNDAYQFLRFFEDPSNEAEARKLGFLEEKVAEEPAPMPKADPEAQPSFKPAEGAK